MNLMLEVFAGLCLTVAIAGGAAIDETVLQTTKSISHESSASPLINDPIQMIERVEKDLKDVETDLNNSKSDLYTER